AAMPETDPARYAFTAALANARSLDGATYTPRFVVLDIRPYDEQAHQAISGIWTRMQAAVESYHKNAAESMPVPTWAIWSVQKWCESKHPPRQKFIAWDGDVIAGFVTLRPDFVSPHMGARRVLYLEHLATAPGNTRTEIWCRRLKHVGQ